MAEQGVTSAAGADELCPCGRGVPYVECCGALHAGEAAPTAERLMRSRYAAFALGIEPYLLQTWHSSTRPRSVELDPSVEWHRLVIEQTSEGSLFDTDGEVTFTAVARTSEGRMERRERSRFVRDERGRWSYLDGGALA